MKKLIILLILTTSISLFAQTYDFTLTVSPTHRTYNVLYPANFNPDEPDLQPDLFTISIIENTPSNNAVLYCKMTWEEEFAEIILTPDGQFPTSLTSSQIINSYPEGFGVEKQTFEDFLDNIEDLIIDTGRMPDGNYVFELGIYDYDYENEQIGDLLSNPGTAVVVIRSPISISLITPGNPVGLGVTNISELYPNFIWFSNLENYTLTIYELDEMYDTIEEIEMLDPHFVETNISGTNYSYSPDAPDFVLNKIYAWQVSAKVLSPVAAAESEYKSTMYLFKLSDTASEELSLQILKNFLNQLGIEGVDESIKLLEAGYTIDNIIWKGKEIPVDELMKIHEEITSGNIEPIKITVE